MPRFMTRLLTLIVIIATPFFILSLSIKLSGFGVDTLKKTLVETETYEIASSKIALMIDEALVDTPRKDPMRKVAEEFKGYLTPSYIEGKANTVIDSTIAWFADSRLPEPSLSFADLKEPLLSKNPGLIDQLLRFQMEYERNLPAMQEALIEQAIADPNTSVPVLPEINLQRFIDNDMTVPLASYVSYLKPLYLYGTYGLYITSMIIASCLALLLVTLPHPENRRKVGTTLLFAAFFSGLPLLARLPFVASRLSVSTIELPPTLIQSYHALSTLAVASYVRAALLTVGGFALLGIVLLRTAKKSV